MSKYKKCSGKFYLCKTLRDRCPDIRYENPAKGLRLLAFSKFGKPTRNLIAYHKDARKDRGLIVNFCPWCGFSFQKRLKYGKSK